MSLPEIQQATAIIDRASSILLLVPEKPSADAFAAMTATYLALEQQHEGVVEAVSPSHVPSQLQFLPGSSQVSMNPTLQPDVVIDIAGPDTITSTRIEQLRGGVRLHAALPEHVTINRDAIEVYVRSLPYDAVIVFGAGDLEDLGDLFTKYADFFYSTPIINIDNRPSNEQFGTVNVIDMTASSVTEVAHELISAMQNTTIDSSIATCLYAGIVAATESFQGPWVKPNAFELAAQLMNEGADKETVVQQLVKTKPLHLLKLTGRLYARLKHDEYGGIFWSVLRPHDFKEAGANTDDISNAMHELINNISGYSVVFLMHEDKPQHYVIHILLGIGLIKRRAQIQEELTAQKTNGTLTFTLSADTLEDAEKLALEKIRPLVA